MCLLILHSLAVTPAYSELRAPAVVRYGMPILNGRKKDLSRSEMRLVNAARYGASIRVGSRLLRWAIT
jgi:hypothetical protein